MSFDTGEYGWKDIQIVVASLPVARFRDIRFTTSRTTEDIYASGDEPHTRYKGNKSYTGSATLLQSAIEALTERAQSDFGLDADITDLTFDIIVTFARRVDLPIKTHILENCDVTEFEMGMEQDDPMMEVELPLAIGKIKYNV